MDLYLVDFIFYFVIYKMSKYIFTLPESCPNQYLVPIGKKDQKDQRVRDLRLETKEMGQYL